MLNRIILWSLHNRLVVLALAALLTLFGVRTAREAPLDVFPDFAPPQVVIQTEAPGLSTEEVEQLVTLPLETALNGASDLNTIRSSSAVGLSVITCVFEAGTDIFRARQLVNEKLQVARARLPQGADEPQMIPISPPVGILLRISLTASQTSMMDLRTLADWTIRPRLLAVPGVAQVVIYGGEVKQYQVVVDPAKLKNYGVTLTEVINAAQRANQNSGAGFLNTVGQTLTIQGEGRVQSLADLSSAVIAVKNNVPVTIAQVAAVRFGAEYKVGDSSTFGKPSVILIVNKQPWANTLGTTKELESALRGLRPSLPPDVVMDPDIFRQADFIERAITNINWAILQGGLLVVLVLAIFLFNWRAGLISLTAIPLSLIVAIVVLRGLGASINSMTLGGLAIAIGEVVDDAIIDVENVFRRLRENRLKDRPDAALSIIYQASSEVRRSVIYGTVIVALVFLPIFSLSGLAGRIFAPLGVAYIVAILASLFVALTVTPALCYFLLPSTVERTAEENFTVRFLKRHYRSLLDPALNHPRGVILISVILFILALIAAQFLGGEFLPEFNEGNLIIHMAGVPGTSLEESMRVGGLAQHRLANVPETVKVMQQTGRAELSEDTYGPNITELHVNLKESERDRDEVVDDVRAQLKDLTGFTFSINQFISERIEEVLSGTTAAIVVKLFGPDLDVLAKKAADVQRAMASVQGVTDLYVEQQTSVPKVLVKFNRGAMAQYGLNSAELADTIRAAFFGAKVAEVFEQQKSFAILVRYEPRLAEDISLMREALIDTPTGAKAPLSALAEVSVSNGPNVINREQAQRRIVVSCNVTSARSLTSVVADIRQHVNAEVKLPTGYYIVYGGQYEAQAAARSQILLLGAAAVIGIFLLLFLAFRSLKQALLVMANLPLALIGGVAAVLLASAGKTSIASLVGFITLFGIATRNGIMLIMHYHHLMAEEGMTFGRELVVRGALERLSPILMTALTAGLALLPLALSEGKPGRELEQPMAVVILGGLLTSTLLNMIVLPALYLKFGRPAAQEEKIATEN
ncbi:MAG: efflux RND transporter permease subunit [Chloracidobacterium sp.]|nr:efflux RND transporter permease subunit [Chloracidobacterium sp.]